MKKPGAYEGKPALDLVEEAVHLLRCAPARLLLTYYLGAVPFALGLLHFWADMTVGAYAARHCAGSALGVAGLFLWMKCWQAVFVSGLRSRIPGHVPEKWDARRAGRMLMVQGVLQPARLFLLPVAFPVVLPFPWALGFFENVTALGDGGAGVAETFQRAARQARLWTGQNFLLVLLLALSGLVVWFNVFITLAAGPFFAKMLLGFETTFTRAGFGSVLNSTFLLATVALAWLALDPLVKAIYSLRCFYGEARHDGADLLADLSLVRARREQLAVAAVVLMMLLPLRAVAAEETPPVTPPPGVSAAPVGTDSPGAVSPAELDDAVKQTLQRDKYSWRTPREAVEETSDEKGWLAKLLEDIGNTLMKWAKAVGKFILKIINWIDRLFRRAHPNDSHSGSFAGWAVVLRGFAYLLLVVALAALGILLYRMWRQGGWRSRALLAEVLPARPDLTDENVTAAQLPEDEWLKLAREMMDKGELRLALRALYLACLAHLAQREFVSIARFKSNRDYEREVARRARGQPEMCAAFSRNVAEFDRVWYGLHEVTRAALKDFQGNLDRIRAC